MVTDESQLDLADTSYAGLSDGSTVLWRVRTEDSTGQVSAWSDAVTLRRISKGTFTIDAPTTLVEEATPEIVTTLTAHAQVAIWYKLEEFNADNDSWRETWSTGRFAAPAGAGVSYSFEVPWAEQVPGSRAILPPIRKKSTPYRLTVRSWDDVAGRVNTPGDKAYAEDTVTFQWVDAVTDPTAPSSLVAEQEADRGPGVVLTWTRAAVPDYWSLVVDDVLVVDKVPALDWQVSGTNYQMTYYGAEPGIEHTFEILALEVA